MKESKAVYVTKRDIKEESNREYQPYANKVVKDREHSPDLIRYDQKTHEVGCQYDSKRDNLICTCRNLATLRRRQEVRYLGLPKQIYAYQGSRSFTDIGVGSVKALQRKKVKKIYLPETDDRGVGSSDLSSFLLRRSRQYRSNSYYENKRTSSKCVGGILEYNIGCVMNEKLSPIVHTISGSTSPRESTLNRNIEIGSNTVVKSLTNTTTQVEDSSKKEIEINPEMKVEEIVQPIILIKEDVKEIKTKTVDSQKTTERIDNPTEKAYSSDSLVQHVHNLESPSEDKISHLSVETEDPMENKLEREYRRIFAAKSKSRDSKSTSDKPITDFKSTSTLKRRFECLRRGLAKREDSKKNSVIVNKEPSQGSAPSHKDVSINSDPPSLEGRSFSNTKTYNPFPPTFSRDKTIYNPRPSHYRRSVTGKKERGSAQWSSRPDDDDSECQGVKGMFKLWGKKFNFEEDNYKRRCTPRPSYNSSSKGPTKPIEEVKIKPEVEEKKEGRKFFFFKKKNKENKEKPYKGKKGLTAGRCEVRDGLMIKIGGGGNTFVPEEIVKEPEILPDNYEEVVRKAWLKKFLSRSNESRNSVQVRWNNNTYAPSSSTVFELMDNVYKDTGVIFRSKSQITVQSSYKSYTKQQVNFVHQNIEAWMIPKTITDKPKLLPVKLKCKSDEERKDNIEVRISDQKWFIDKSKAFSHKIEVVLHSKNFSKLNTKESSDYLRIDIPKGFFVDSSSDDNNKQPTNQSSEEVYKIVEYETGSDLKKEKAPRNLDIGDHKQNNIKVTVSVKENKDCVSKVLETTIKRPPVHRDVVIQGSNVHIPKRCDVIGVGIITQRDLREVRKPILKIQDEDYSDEESEHNILKPNQKQCEFAESYLQEYYRHWTPLGIDLYSWCVSDSHLRCCSENSRTSFNNQGDGSKSCPNIFDDFQASTIVSSCGASSCSQCHTHDDKDQSAEKSSWFGKFKKKSKDSGYKKDGPTRRILPKDSIEVFKRRKIYASSMKSKWGTPTAEFDQPYCVPSIESKGAQNTTLTECPKLMKSCCKPIEPRPRRRTCKKHVSLPDCDTMNELLARQLAATAPEGILAFKGGGCEICKRKGSCPKHAKVNPNPSCEIPRAPCRDSCEQMKKPPCEDSRVSCDKPPGCPPPESPCGSCPPTPPPCIKPPSCPATPPPCKKPPSCPATPPPCKKPPSCPSIPSCPSNPSCPPSPPPCKKPKSPPPCPPSPPPCKKPPSCPPTPPPSCKTKPPCPPSPPPCQKKPPCPPSPPPRKKSPPSPPPCRKPPSCPPTPPSRKPPSCPPSPPPCKKPPSCPPSPPPCKKPPSCPPSPPPCKKPPPLPPSPPPCRKSPPCPPSPPSKKPPPCPPSPPPCKKPSRSPPSPASCPHIRATCPPSPLPCPQPPPPCPHSPPTCPHSPPPCPHSPPRCPHSPPPCPHFPPPCPPPPCPPPPCPRSPPTCPHTPPCPPSPPPPCYHPPPPCPHSPPCTPPPPRCVRAPKKCPMASPTCPLSPPICCSPDPNRCPALPPPCKKASSNICNKFSPFFKRKTQMCPASPPCKPTPCKPSSCKTLACQPSPCLIVRQSSPSPCKKFSKTSCSYGSLHRIPDAPFIYSPIHPCPPEPKKKPESCNLSPCNTRHSKHKPPLSESKDPNPVKPYEDPRTCDQCRTSINDDFPWPTKNQVSNQSSVASFYQTTENQQSSDYGECIKDCPMMPKLSCETIPSPKKECKKSCPNKLESPPPPCIPAMQCPPPKPPSPPPEPIRSPSPEVDKCNTKPKVSGLYLKMKPVSSKKKSTCSKDCLAWDSGPEDGCISLNSEEKITIRLKKETPSTQEIREGLNIKVQDEDGMTLFERKDYRLQHAGCSMHRPSLLGDMFQASEVRTVTTNNSVQALETEKNCRKDITETKSDASIANLIEIQFKLKVTQGEKTTEINIANDGEKENEPEEKVDQKEGINKIPQEVFIVKDGERLVDHSDQKNDINIRIVIKNFKPKSGKKKSMNQKHDDYSKEFSKQISAKFHTVSTGYSDVIHDDNVFSVHRATVDLTSSVDKSKTHSNKSEEIMSEPLIELGRGILMGSSDPSICRCITTDMSEGKSEDTEVKSVSSQKYSAAKEIQENQEETDTEKLTDHKYEYTEETDTEKPIKYDTEETDTDKQVEPPKYDTEETDTEKRTEQKYDTFMSTDTDEADTLPEIKKPKSIEVIVKPHTKDEKKEMLKHVFEKAHETKTKNKTRMRKLRDMLKVILTSDSSDHDETKLPANELAKDVTYASLKPNYFRDSDSMNNYYRVESNPVLSESEINRQVVYPTIENNSECSNSNQSDVLSSENESPKREGCMCSTLAARLKLASRIGEGGGCCCATKHIITKKSEETTCDLKRESDYLQCDYKTTEFVDVETQNSRYLTSKINSTNLSLHRSLRPSLVGNINLQESIKTASGVINVDSKHFYGRKTFSPHMNHVRECEMRKLNRNTILSISDEDKIVLMSGQSTRFSVEPNKESDKKKKYKDPLTMLHASDILQSYETKKAVLEIYTEKTISDEGERLVAKLPKFVYDRENEIQTNYEAMATNTYKAVCKRNIVMMAINR